MTVIMVPIEYQYEQDGDSVSYEINDRIHPYIKPITFCKIISK